MGIRSQNSLAQPGAGDFPQILNIAVGYLGFFGVFLGLRGVGKEDPRGAHSQSGISDGLGILGAPWVFF